MTRNGTRHGRMAVAGLLIVLGFAIVMAPLPSNGQVAGKPAQMSLEDTFKKREKEWRDIVMKHDAGGLERYMTSDAVLVTPGRGVTNREEWIRDLQQMHADSYDLEVVRVKVYGDVALVTSKWTLAGLNGDPKLSLKGNITDVWTLQGGEWKLALRQGSPLPNPPPAPTP